MKETIAPFPKRGDLFPQRGKTLKMGVYFFGDSTTHRYLCRPSVWRQIISSFPTAQF